MAQCVYQATGEYVCSGSAGGLAMPAMTLEPFKSGGHSSGGGGGGSHSSGGGGSHAQFGAVDPPIPAKPKIADCLKQHGVNYGECLRRWRALPQSERR